MTGQHSAHRQRVLGQAGINENKKGIMGAWAACKGLDVGDDWDEK